mmetsp:Transcript_7277/g.12089  ORF Transcript_7277/g.12089 Transcript_7277/m.12089 type:complete len:442 (+) Transcript_7277:132-1457(+)
MRILCLISILLQLQFFLQCDSRLGDTTASLIDISQVSDRSGTKHNIKSLYPQDGKSRQRSKVQCPSSQEEENEKDIRHASKFYEKENTILIERDVSGPAIDICNARENVETSVATDAAHIVASAGSSSSTSMFHTLDANGTRVLTYYGLMTAGAVARSAAATAVHPLNVIKTLLQTKGGKMPAFRWRVLSRGAGSQLIMSVPHGAISFAVTETTKMQMAKLTGNTTLARLVPPHVLNPALDFLASSISTFICSVVSTPQMVLSDRIMAGVYDNFFVAVLNIARSEGLLGFYRGWLPALVQKIPSYALTWMMFQQLKQWFRRVMDRAGSTVENTMLGSLAAAGACCIMIPVDTIKTRLVTQRPGTEQHYDGMWDCLTKILKHEGVGALYRALPPRLFSVVPMIGIQFGVYELMKRLLVGQPPPKQKKSTILERAAEQQKESA